MKARAEAWGKAEESLKITGLIRSQNGDVGSEGSGKRKTMDGLRKFLYSLGKGRSRGKNLFQKRKEPVQEPERVFPQMAGSTMSYGKEKEGQPFRQKQLAGFQRKKKQRKKKGVC